MEGIRDAISRMVKAGLQVKKLQESYVKTGLDDNALFEVWGDILEAIYHLIGEHTETFDESKTAIIMNAPCLSVELRSELLFNEFVRNNCATQGKPVTFTEEQTNDMFRKSGGYRFETPEGDWT